MSAKKSTKKSAKKAKADDANGKPKRTSAIDAAAKLLAGSKQAMTCKELIEAMAAKGYWSSPNGQTPAATLCAAISREIGNKGKDARFKKTERGHFATNG